MDRKFTQKLIAWKNRPENRLPMLVMGPRQVGKTYTLRAFGSQNYTNFLYINFEQSPQYQSIFDGDLSPDRIIRELEIYSERSIDSATTLIFFDEIQVCERALTALKYFAESDKVYHIVAAGSLLGVAINRDKYSFPVGKVFIETLQPLDFEEFLMAMGMQNLIGEIKAGFEADRALPQALHEKALDLVFTYMMTGGMPAAVAEYLKNKSLAVVAEVQANILTAYVADMAKYTSASDSVKVRTAFDSLPVQLAKENRKFQYKVIKKGASASHFGAAIDWLCASGIVRKCRRIEHGFAPIASHVDLSAFKLYMTDTGLLFHKSGMQPRAISRITTDIAATGANQFKGALVENYVAQAIGSSGHDLYYWESASTAEIDFVVTRGEETVPVEVKSSDNVRSRSLAVFVQKYKPKYAVRISTKNFGLENDIKSVPLYAAFLI